MPKKNSITNSTMLENFDTQGLWWLSEDKEDKITGNLYTDDGSIYLDIIGKFGKISDNDLKIEYIHGYTVKGEKLTLVNNFNIKTKYNMPGLAQQSYKIDYVITGDHLENIEAIKFRSISLHTTYLTEWFGGWKFKDKVEKVGTSKEFSMTLTSPNITSFKIPNMNSVIKNRYNFHMNTDGIEQINLKYNESLEIEPQEWKTFVWFEKNIDSIIKLLTLLMNETVHLERLVLYGENEDTQTLHNRKKEYHLYYSRNNEDVKKKFYSHQMLFTHEKIKANINEIFNNWFEKEPLLENVYNLYLDNIINNKVNLEPRFLNAIQTIEVYHRSLEKGKLFSDEDKENYLKIISESLKDKLPEEILEKANKSLYFFNEYSLSKRLKDIINDLEEETIEFLFKSKKNSKSFIQKAVNTRNYLTHYDKNNLERTFKEFKLYDATIILKVLSGIILFKEIGLEENYIIEVMKENDKLSQQVNRAKKNLIE